MCSSHPLLVVEGRLSSDTSSSTVVINLVFSQCRCHLSDGDRRVWTLSFGVNNNINHGSVNCLGVQEPTHQ